MRLVVRREGVEGVLRVEDTGDGIPPEHLGRIFDRFYRIDQTRVRATGGAGLGLAIAHALMVAHAGGIELSGRPDGGTRATIWLPLASDEPRSKRHRDRDRALRAAAPG